MKNKKVLQDWLLNYIPTVLCAALILYFAIVREQHFIHTLPTLITLAVQLLLVFADRRAFLVGGTNSLIYGASYFIKDLYFSAFSAVFISAPMQFFSFFRWRKGAKKEGTALRIMPWYITLLWCIGTVAAWGVLLLCAYSLFETAAYPTLDALMFAIGITVTLLAAFGYVESQYLNILNSSFALLLWILYTIKDPANMNYLIISVYNLFRVIQTSVNWTAMYRASKKRS